MEFIDWNQTAARNCFFVIALLLTISMVVLVQPFLEATGTLGVATYSHGVLHLTIPYRATHAGKGRLTLEVLDPEDQVIGKIEKSLEVEQASSQWKEEVKLDKAPAMEDLVWHRLRYQFVYDQGGFVDLQGTESIAQILHSPVLRIFGQQTYLSGSHAAVRVIVTDSENAAISGRSALRIDLQVSGQRRTTLFTGQLNHRSTAEAQFQFPAGLAGDCELHYVVDTTLGSTEFTQAIRLEEKVGILLTTEKPIYQPGQTIHIRALALDRTGHDAVGNRDLVFELEDSRGNKVFKKATRTDEFGVASAEFQLASEVNLGAYHLRGLLGEPGSDAANTAEIALNVQKYVLPKFKVELNFTSKNDKKKHGYRPGDRVTGTVQTNYFFGKPLDSAEISLKAIGMDVSTFEAASVEGKTDHEGKYPFEMRIPSYLAGRPLNQGAARLLIEVTVKDSAGHSETKGEPITVSESPFLIMAVPEGGMLIPNLENQVYLMASYPDGTPVKADLTVHPAAGVEQRVSTDEGGVATIRLKAAGGDAHLRVEGKDAEGESVSTTVSMQFRAGEDQVLLRTEHAVYRAGDPIHLRIFATKKRGTAYIDIVKQGQTILTRDLDITDGQAELAVTASPEMAGMVDFNAYLFGRNAQPIVDHRLIFVQPAEELKVETVADAAVYKPGGDAKIWFRVTNSHGQGVRAALGLQIVDQAVFALAEKQPGFAKVFFYLEQEVMKPRYEIHSVGLPEVVEQSGKSEGDHRDRAARVLFSATEIVSQNRFETEVGRSVSQTKYYEYWNRYLAQFRLDSKKIAEELRRASAVDTEPADVKKIFEKLANSGKAEFRDPWGTPLQLEPVNWDASRTQYVIRGAGPDKRFRTGDDLTTYLYFRRRKLVAPACAGPSRMDIRLEHDWGAFNNKAEISGVVVDQSGAAMEGAVVTARELPSGSVRTIRADNAGTFRFSAVPKGKYQIVVASVPLIRSEAAMGGVTLEPRDHAVVTAHVRYELAAEVVEVTASAEIVAATDATVGFAGGMPGGVMEGVAGDVAFRATTQSVEVRSAAPPMPAPPASIPMASNGRNFKQVAEVTAGQQGSPDVHVRSYFPEALYINPEIITDRDGNASISIPMADNITTWRMAMLASTQHGALGTGTSSLKVFQDFFVDLDLPVTLTQGDQVSIPVAIYNYTDAKGDVRLNLESGDWFSLLEDVGEKSVNVDAGRVGGSQFTLQAKRIGKFKLTLSARMKGDSKRADIVVREIEVVPNGREQSVVYNGQLESTVSHNVEFPARAIPGASKVFVRLYPGPLSQVMEGMDAILRIPGGCFEQTSSSTYPNVLALDYMKRTKKLTPEVHAKAEGYIANGYQRLLTFEVPGGGFSWFGQAPANKVLTAYGLMEFYDMSKVHEVDPRLIQRTQQWLASDGASDAIDGFGPALDFEKSAHGISSRSRCRPGRRKVVRNFS